MSETRSARTLLKNLAGRAGISLMLRRNTLAGAREGLLRGDGIDLVVDVGAHFGEYGNELRRGGYRGAILSFEPIPSHFERLEARAAADPLWTVRNAGLAAAAGEETINISGNDGFGSSLLDIESAHTDALADTAYVATTSIELETLDEARSAVARRGRSIYLKIDTQGYELEVIKGATQTLEDCLAVELELSTVPLYTGQPLIGEMLSEMRERHFRPIHIEPEFVDPKSGELLQVNALFTRHDPVR